jgi:glycosyltransferase involved in cell wall biosynthesis
MRKDERVSVVTKASDGPGLARNMGLARATGVYITFVDGDDQLEPDAIEIMLSAAESRNADISLGDIYYVSELNTEEGVLLEKKYSKLRLDETKDIIPELDTTIVNKCRTYTWGKLFKRQFLLDNNFCQGSYAYEDVASIPIIVAKARRIAYVNKPVYIYLRNRKNSLVNDRCRVVDMITALDQMHEGLIELHNSKLYEAEFIRIMWSQIRFVCLKHSESMVKGDDRESLYDSLVKNMKKYFEHFVSPEECYIYTSDKRCIEIIKNIVITADRLMINNDYVKNNSMNIVSEKWEKQYELPYLNEESETDETTMWNIADEVFYYIWC